ncbi:MAG: glycine zipper 2TM domain-containing protein [Thermomonas sp.]|uniref:glycine zipper 2TM domain-containing protein n=1 Tax=Thermomonas sp. TaxID=1971895 RepID=UPI0039E64AF4
MKRPVAILLALGLAAASTNAFAQSGYDRYDDGRYDNGRYDSGRYDDGRYDDGQYRQDGGTHYDYARVIRVDPVLDGSYRSTANDYGQRRCYETTTNDGYARDGYYRDGYYDERYGDYDRNGYRRGSDSGRNVATIVGGIAGAVLGSKMGGGSGTYAATAIGSMVGGMAGREIYDQTQRNRSRTATVRVCDPEPVGRYGDGRYDSYRTSGANAYDVTYEYNGRRYTRRMDYHPGDRVRVRVDVSPE